MYDDDVVGREEMMRWWLDDSGEKPKLLYMLALFPLFLYKCFIVQKFGIQLL